MVGPRRRGRRDDSPCFRARHRTRARPRLLQNTPACGSASKTRLTLVGHTRGTTPVQSGSFEDPRRPEVPVPPSAPGVSRTPDLQVRSLTTVLTQPISHHPSPVGTRQTVSRRGVRWAAMGSVWAQFGHSQVWFRPLSVSALASRAEGVGCPNVNSPGSAAYRADPGWMTSTVRVMTAAKPNPYRTRPNLPTEARS